MARKYYRDQFDPNGRRLEVVENYGHPGTTAYKINLYRTLCRGMARKHRVVFTHPRYGRDARFKLYHSSQRRWYKLFQVPDDVIVPFTYFDHSRALGFMKVISGLGVNFTNILHLKSEMWFYRPLVPGERYVIDYVFEDVVKVKHDKAAILNYSAITKDGEFYQEHRDNFIIKNVKKKYLDRLQNDDMNQFKGITRLPADPIEDVKIKEIYIPMDLPVKYTSASGDCSYMHITPRAAKIFGFGKPFLQGLCTANLLMKELVMAGVKLEYFSIVFCLPVYLDDMVYLNYNDHEYRLQDSQGKVLAFGALNNGEKPPSAR